MNATELRKLSKQATEIRNAKAPAVAPPQNAQELRDRIAGARGQQRAKGAPRAAETGERAQINEGALWRIARRTNPTEKYKAAVQDKYPGAVHDPGRVMSADGVPSPWDMAHGLAPRGR